MFNSDESDAPLNLQDLIADVVFHWDDSTDDTRDGTDYDNAAHRILTVFGVDPGAVPDEGQTHRWSLVR